MGGTVEAVSRSPRHRFSKQVEEAVTLVEGHGVEGDAHAGATIQHRSRKRWRPDDPNPRQVHLLHAELLDLLRGLGFAVAPGEIGENVLTRGIDLLGLPRGARLRLGGDAVVEVTGLRNPCVQLDRFQDGLMEAVLRRTPDGELERLAGVMGVVLAGGEVRAGDPVTVELPQGERLPLRPV
jgi:MOSC domain-containing protein YiiM